MDTKKQKKIKVLRIIARLNIGGPAIHAILLTGGIDKNRFETVLVSGVTSKGEGDMFYLAKEKNVNPVIIQELGRNLNIRNDIIAFFKIYKLLNKEKPDIIHTHTAKAGALGRLAGIFYRFFSRNKCILIHTFHGHIFHSYFDNLSTKLFLWTERFLARFTDTIITISKQQYYEIKNVFKVSSKDNIEVIPLGFDLEPYLNSLRKEGNFRKDLKVSDNEILVGIVGRLVPIKNHRLLLEAASQINGDLAGRIKFIIIGDGELKATLVDYAKDLSMENRVIFAGWRKDLYEIYPDLDIVALTSLNEGTPISVIEAMACARPVIASDVGGVKDLIEDGVTGILFRRNNSKELSSAIIRLAQDEILRKKIGDTARNKVREIYSAKRLVRDIENLYENLIREREEK